MSNSPDEALSVSELTTVIKQTLEQAIPPVWVAGEICDLARPRSGHLYFTLKDAHSQIRAVMWRSAVQRLPFQLEDGQAVLALGGIEVYAPRGSYQLIIRRLQPQGVGSLQLAFEQLRAKLAAEGLFDAAAKRALPRFPLRVGFVTSPTGAAVRDFCEVAARRWRGIEIIVIPARVQGAGAAEEIIQGIRCAARIQPSLDVLVVGRGGGSMEDLWCFNDERLVRAVAECEIPTISAVGHEIDVTLCDLAADVRALTPTEAAERLLPASDDLLVQLQNLLCRLHRSAETRIHRSRDRVAGLESRPVVSRPFDFIFDHTRTVDEFDMRLRSLGEARMRLTAEKLRGLSLQLESLSPLATLNRGYSIVTHAETERVVCEAADAGRGDTLHIRTARANIEATVERCDAL